MRRLLALGLPVLILACSTYTIEHRKRSSWEVAMDRTLPMEVVRDDGTIVRYSTNGGSASRLTQEYLDSLDLRSEDEVTGEVTLRAVLPEHLLQHLLSCLRDRNWDLVHGQLISEATRANYSGEEGRAKFDEWFERHRRELARTMQRMLHGLSFGDILFHEEGTIITMTFAPGIRGDYPFTTIDMVREGEYLTLGVIR